MISDISVSFGVRTSSYKLDYLCAFWVIVFVGHTHRIAGIVGDMFLVFVLFPAVHTKLHVNFNLVVHFGCLFLLDTHKMTFTFVDTLILFVFVCCARKITCKFYYICAFGLLNSKRVDD